jgi:hypothetical protein
LLGVATDGERVRTYIEKFPGVTSLDADKVVSERNLGAADRFLAADGGVLEVAERRTHCADRSLRDTRLVRNGRSSTKSAVASLPYATAIAVEVTSVSEIRTAEIVSLRLCRNVATSGRALHRIYSIQKLSRCYVLDRTALIPSLFASTPIDLPKGIQRGFHVVARQCAPEGSPNSIGGPTVGVCVRDGAV